jgi:anti-sigma regulatory factor (Ser/Thr protein kinase)
VHTERTRVRPLTVVVADARRPARAAVRRALSASDAFTVVGEAAAAGPAVETAVREQADQAVLALGLRPRTGLDALARVRAERPECVVLVASDLRRVAVLDDPTRLERDLHCLLGLPLVRRDGSEGGDACAVELPPARSSVATARAFVEDALVRAGRADLTVAAALLTSEIMTNAIVHARSAARVEVRAIGDVVRVEVTDWGRGALTLRDTAPTVLGGRGLHIVDALADAWGTCAAPGAKVVWFEVGRA